MKDEPTLISSTTNTRGASFKCTCNVKPFVHKQLSCKVEFVVRLKLNATFETYETKQKVLCLMLEKKQTLQPECNKDCVKRFAH